MSESAVEPVRLGEQSANANNGGVSASLNDGNLGQQFLDNVAVDVGQAKITALEPVG